MTRTTQAGMKAIWGIVLMVNLAMVPLYNAAIAKGNNEPVPYTPDTTPEWSFGMEEGTVAVMGAVGVMGSEAEVSLQPEINDPAIQDLLDFHVLAFETVFGRAYDGTESAYFFEQPLDELTYATVVPGWNTVGEPVDALVLLAQPIDVSDIDPGNGVTVISAAHIAGTLEGVDTQGFWGISMVYDFSDGVRYNDLFLMSELDAGTEEALMARAGLLEYGYNRGESEVLRECVKAAEEDYDNCMDDAHDANAECTGAALIGGATCLLICAALNGFPGFGIFLSTSCAVKCIGVSAGVIIACQAKFGLSVAKCYSTFKDRLKDCGVTIADIFHRSSSSRIAFGDGADLSELFGVSSEHGSKSATLSRVALCQNIGASGFRVG